MDCLFFVVRYSSILASVVTRYSEEIILFFLYCLIKYSSQLIMQTQHVLWRLSNGELDNIKPKVCDLLLFFLVFPHFNVVNDMALGGLM